MLEVSPMVVMEGRIFFIRPIVRTEAERDPSHILGILRIFEI